MTEVFGALRDGDQIIVNPRNDMKDGAQVAMN
jgi:membrane fusion protein (multidrug efflux system)